MSPPLLTWLLWLLLAWFMAGVVIAFVYRRALVVAWREPVLAVPVLITESDDWGPGPGYQVAALRALIDCLNSVTDQRGRKARITLGLTLSVPDGGFIQQSECREYQPRWLDDPVFSDQLAVLKEGINQGVFDPQLHGSAHYWPPALLRAAESDLAVRDWLLNDPLETEQLPSPLQSRWTDASVLPSRALARQEMSEAVEEEVSAYARIFGIPPRVVVPPTFVWNPEVEQAWSDAGVRCLVTPGRRYTRRNADGQPGGADGVIHNGQPGRGYIRYLVRDLYFEPVLGHRAETTLAQMAQQTSLGRPCMLEMHRFNFVAASCAASVAELKRLLESAVDWFPGLRFLSSEELDLAYRDGGEVIESSVSRRGAVFIERLFAIPRFSRLLRMMGLALPLRLYQRWAA